MKKAVLRLSLLTTICLICLLLLSPYRVSYRFPGSQEVVTHTADGRSVRVALWREDPLLNGLRRRGILFIHGLTAQGPQQPVYAMLCDALAKQGFVVAAPWLRGYDSDKALDLGNEFVPARWNPLPDIEAAFTFLQNDPQVDPEQIFVVGHSLGGGYALLFGLQRRDVAGIVSFSRLDMESRLRDWPGYLEKFRLTLSQVFGLDEPMSVKNLQDFADSQIFPFELFTERFATPDHPPVLFAIGGRERLDDRQWLWEYSAKAGRGTEYYEFSGVTHWLNFRAFRGIWVYEPRKISQVASTLAHWLRGQSFTEP